MGGTDTLDRSLTDDLEKDIRTSSDLSVNPFSKHKSKNTTPTKGGDATIHDYYDPKNRSLPITKILPICLMLFTESINANSLFAYVGYMVLDFGDAHDKQDVG